MFQSLLHQGISLLAIDRAVRHWHSAKFQSLLHQGISLLHVRWPGATARRAGVSIPSSSGHQFTVRHLEEAMDPSRYSVSIPSSSGHQFTEPCAMLPSSPSRAFQSLLHQGISLLNAVVGRR